MTIEQAKSKVIQWATAQLWTHEGDNNWNKYAEMPEMEELLGYDVQRQPWCNVFVNAAFLACFGLNKGAAMLYQPVGHGSALCRQSAQWFKEHDAFTQNPKDGDIIFFFVSGAINHMGIVSKVDGNHVYTIEGNSGDTVAERVYALGAYNIAGYGRPRWELAETEPQGGCDGDACDINIPLKADPAFPVLRNGMGGNWVAAAQGILHAQKYSLGPCGVDGEFGEATMAAVRNFQIRNNLSADGIIGPQTWAVLLPQSA